MSRKLKEGKMYMDAVLVLVIFFVVLFLITSFICAAIYDKMPKNKRDTQLPLRHFYRTLNDYVGGYSFHFESTWKDKNDKIRFGTHENIQKIKEISIVNDGSSEDLRIVCAGAIKREFDQNSCWENGGYHPDRIYYINEAKIYPTDQLDGIAIIDRYNHFYFLRKPSRLDEYEHDVWRDLFMQE